ncbi:PilZ domain-containing protein [Candidatus Venteria ishoeyi]|uniref:PilZ domain-containing protein n=1 Tax=Candidatus Venteria ishoeyi TaxID=1899563 RepID=UPI0025A5DCB0|nr:PilZ domain-containing protein [Candidatus Venteria ishoeyi]MDM8546283.1 PilZ domain-containing protein [Candidatus Venteria ishoeyi]
MDTHKEKRRNRRWDLVLYLPVIDQKEGRIIGYLSDITTMGVMVLSEKPIALEEEHLLSIHLEKLPSHDNQQESGKSYIHFRASSRWSKPINNNLYMLGFMITEISAEDLDAIRLLIRQIGIYQFVDIMIQIDDITNAQERQRLEEAVCETEGVASAVFESDNPHLMIIQYELGEVGSAQILQQITAQGIRAHLVIL